MPLTTVGVFLLWLGWFGFNGGSVLSADPTLTSFTLVTTCLAAAAGGIGAMIAYTFVSSKPDLSMALNGILAGLVGITAGADVINPNMAILVGLIAGMLVVGSVLTFDKLKIDDPVGAISVHLTCGIWGTLAVGLFSTNPDHSLVTQAIGVVCYAIFTVACAPASSSRSRRRSDCASPRRRSSRASISASTACTPTTWPDPRASWRTASRGLRRRDGLASSALATSEN